MLTDLSMPKMDGLELMAQIGARDPQLPVILLTAHGSERVAVAAMKQGAYDYLAKPFDIDEVARRDRTRARDAPAARRQPPARRRADARPPDHRRVAADAPACSRRRSASPRATSPCSCAARPAPARSSSPSCCTRSRARANKPLVRFNCAALPAELADAELFGHVRGAFTGAVVDAPGFFLASQRRHA